MSQISPSEFIRSRRLCEDAAFERKHTCVSDGSSNLTNESYPLPCVMNSQTAMSKATLLIGKNNALVMDCFTSVRLVLRCLTVQAIDVPTVSQLPESLCQQTIVPRPTLTEQSRMQKRQLLSLSESLINSRIYNAQVPFCKEVEIHIQKFVNRD